MRILLAIHQFENPSAGGTEVYTRALAARLAERHDVAVLYPLSAPSSKPAIERTHDGEVRHYRLRAPLPADSFEDNWTGERLRALCAEALAEFAPDIVHVQHLSGLGAAFVDEARKHASRIVMTFADYWLFCPRGQMIRDDLRNCMAPEETRCAACAFGTPMLRQARARVRGALGPLGQLVPEGLAVARASTWLAHAAGAALPAQAGPLAPAREKITTRLDGLQQALAKIDLFIAPSHAIGRACTRLGVPYDKVRRLDYGFEDLALPEGHSRTLAGPLRLGFLGTLIPSKGLHIVARALRLLSPGLVDLHIWGAYVNYHGDESYRNELGRRLARVAHVNHGPVSHEDVPRALSQIDALVVPSLWRENSPLVIHEAMQAGIPVIAARVGGIPELVRDGETGFTYAPTSASELAEKLRMVAGGYEFPHRENWRHAVEEMGTHARRVEALYLEGVQW